jgi:hypothetical protein
MENRTIWSSFILGTTISLGIIIASFFISDALVKLRAANRYVIDVYSGLCNFSLRHFFL